MARSDSLPAILKTLTESLTSAASTFPSTTASLTLPVDRISLLDTKNDLLLSYLQNLVYLILLKLKDVSALENLGGALPNLADGTVHQLVKIQTYLDKGVRPLEGRLKYQIEKALAAAGDAERKKLKQGKTTLAHDGKPFGDLSDSSSGSSHGSRATPKTTSASAIDDLSYRPNPSAFFLGKAGTSTSAETSKARAGTSGPGGQTYKPPRITPTSMPNNAPTSSGQHGRSERRARKFQLLDEYASTELSSLPVAEPSIGTNATILGRGRGALSAKERERQNELINYEERNFTRLPGQSKSEKKNGVGARSRSKRDRFGGEDWTGLGEMGDRVARSLTKRGDQESVLERRNKRNRETAISESNGNAALNVGQHFEKRRKILQARTERKKTNS